MEIKEIKDKIDEKFDNLKKQVEEKTGVSPEEFNEVKSQIDALQEKGVKQETIEKMQGQLDKMDVKLQKKRAKQSKEKKTFGQSLKKSLGESQDDLKALQSKNIKSLDLSLKADGDLNPGNYGGDSLEISTQEIRGLRETQYSPMWLREMLPNSTTNKSVIKYLKENGWNGEAGIWDGSGDIGDLDDKPGVSPNFEDAQADIEWIAGLAFIKRDQLDDIEWLQNYLQRKLTEGKRGLFVAENKMIMDAFDDNNEDYDGDKELLVEAIYDAAFGQLRDNYLTPSFVLVNSRDLVNKIALNKAEDSGVYNLPADTVVTVNGQTTVGGVPLVGLPEIGENEFYAVAGNETEFVSRMAPEVRFFEQDDKNIRKNLVTARAEERAGVIIYDDNAIVKGEAEEEEEG